MSLLALAGLNTPCSGVNYAAQLQNAKTYNSGINIIPKPVSLIEGKGSFTLNGSTKISSSKQLRPIADFFAAKIQRSTGLDITQGKSKTNCITLLVDPSIKSNTDEAYTLSVSPSGVVVKGKSAAAVFFGMQSFMQLLPAEIESPTVVNGLTWSAPSVTIEDYPRFKYRGMHLDVCRHFNGVDFIKKQLDVLSLFKINRFHWHLTDDQLWTIEIKKYPKLTQIGSDRIESDGTHHKGFFTQEQIKEVVKYANDRFIDVIPEIELPGHAIAALTAYPEYSCTGGPFKIRNVWGVESDVFCAGRDETFTFLEDIISEVAPLFTSEYFHVGGDECPKDRWEACPRCQKRIKDEGLKDELELQSYFVQRIEKHVNKLGKKMIGWDEILEGGIAPNATVMSWRGETGGITAANADHDVIMTPGNWLYLDYYQGGREVEDPTIGGYTPLEKTYSYNPMPKDIAADKSHHVIGAQANIWAEYMYTPQMVENRIYPRVLALAELTWTPLESKNFTDFSRRVNNAHVRLDGHQINYHIPLPEGPLSNYIAYIDGVSLGFFNTRNYPMVYTTDASEPTPQSTQYTDSLRFTSNTTLKIATLLPSDKLSRTRTLTIARESLSKASDVSTKRGVLMCRTEGNYQNSSQYASVKFTTPCVIEDFTPTFDDKKPCVEKNEGYFDVPEDGIYMICSDNEELWIDGRLLIDNNNKVKMHMRNKQTMALEKGKHKFLLIMNNGIVGGRENSRSANTFYIKAPSAKELTKVTPNMLSYDISQIAPIYKTIEYKSIDTTKLTLDIFTPETIPGATQTSASGQTTAAPRAAIVLFFGGGWNNGSKQQFHRHAMHLASQGMVAVVADYRTRKSAGTTPFESVADAKSAMRYVRSHAAEFNIDPQRIAAGGGSAGGHLAAATAYVKSFDDPTDNRQISPVPNALVLFNPVIDNSPEGYGYDRVEKQYRKFSPMHNIKKTAVPTLFMLGDKDDLIPVVTAYKFKTITEKAGAECIVKIYEGAKHGFYNYTKAGNKYYTETVAETDRFLHSLNYID